MLDQRGALLGSAGFCASTRGYADALSWLEGHGRVDGVAVESTGSYAAGLVRYLRAHLVRVVEVNQPHPHTRRRVGKSDPVDPEMAARQLLLAGTAAVVPKQTTGIVDAIRLLRVARESRRGKASLCARFRISKADMADPTIAAKLALRSIVQRIEALDREIASLDHELEDWSSAPRRAPSNCWASPPDTLASF